MSEYAFIFPLTFLLAGIIAYIAHKRHWQLTKIF